MMMRDPSEMVLWTSGKDAVRSAFWPTRGLGNNTEIERNVLEMFCLF